MTNDPILSNLSYKNKDKILRRILAIKITFPDGAVRESGVLLLLNLSAIPQLKI